MIDDITHTAPQRFRCISYGVPNMLNSVNWLHNLKSVAISRFLSLSLSCESWVHISIPPLPLNTDVVLRLNSVLKGRCLVLMYTPQRNQDAVLLTVVLDVNG